MEKRRRLSKEFKREAIQMARGAKPLSIKRIAMDLGIYTNLLSWWALIRIGLND